MYESKIPDLYNPSDVTPSLAQLVFDKPCAPNSAQKGKPQTVAPPAQGGWVTANFIKYDMKDFLEQCVEKYQKLSESKVTLRKVDTPFIDESKDIEEVFDEKNPGKLKSVASAVLMKCLYAARMARFDLLRPITALAKLVTKWSPRCDRMLHKLMCYINSTLDVAMYGWIADNMKSLEIVLYSDADFAGDRADARSQSGMYLALEGKNSHFPMNAFSKRQGSTAKSTPEAEIVAANDALKVALPHLDLWEKMLGRPKLTIRHMEDNESAIRIYLAVRIPPCLIWSEHNV
jgi:hypothetical protein